MAWEEKFTTVKCIQFTIVLDKEAWMDHFKINNNKSKGKGKEKKEAKRKNYGAAW